MLGVRVDQWTQEDWRGKHTVVALGNAVLDAAALSKIGDLGPVLVGVGRSGKGTGCTAVPGGSRSGRRRRVVVGGGVSVHDGGAQVCGGWDGMGEEEERDLYVCVYISLKGLKQAGAVEGEEGRKEWVGWDGLVDIYLEVQVWMWVGGTGGYMYRWRDSKQQECTKSTVRSLRYTPASQPACASEHVRK